MGHRLAVAVVLSAIAVSPALAAEPWIGRWAVTTEGCSAFGGSTAATSALVVTDTGLNWYSGYCRIGKMYKLGQSAYIQARCWTDNDVPVSLEPRGDRMRVTWAGAKQEMRRCN